MHFTDETVLNNISVMLDKLYERDSFLLTKELNITERAITHRMGLYLQQIFSDEVDVDCEYNRMGLYANGELSYTEGDYFAKTVCLSKGSVSDDDTEGSRVFPDIIVHKRGTAQNYVIIEVKIQWKNGKSEHDFQKLAAYKSDLKYQYAFYIELNETRADVLVKQV